MRIKKTGKLKSLGILFRGDGKRKYFIIGLLYAPDNSRVSCGMLVRTAQFGFPEQNDAIFQDSDFFGDSKDVKWIF